MAYYKPCKNCAVDKATCARRTDIAKAIAGMSVTVINFRCAARRSLFHSGQRVQFDWTSWENGDEFGEPSGIGLVYHGTVIEEHGLRFIVRVDDDRSVDENEISARDTFKSDNLVIKVRPAAMQALDEPDRKLCQHCSAYAGEEAPRCQGWGDGIDSYWPTGCFHRPQKGVAA